MLKKILGLAAAMSIALVGVAATASAQDYPTPPNSFTADDTTVAPGETIVLSIQVCRPGTSAGFTLDGGTSLGSATANGDGRATLKATIPSSTAPGSHTITATCTGANGQPLTQMLNFTVTGGARGTGAGSTQLFRWAIKSCHARGRVQ